jgi:hypothetical protein
MGQRTDRIFGAKPVHTGNAHGCSLTLSIGRVRHFRPLAGRKKDVGIIGVSANLPIPQVDSKLTALLTKSTPTVFEGKFTPLIGETEE